MPAWMSLLDALLVPEAKSPLSISRTLVSPRSAISRRQPAPTMPPPTTRTSSGRLRSRRDSQVVRRVRNENSRRLPELRATVLLERRLDAVDGRIDVGLGKCLGRILQANAERDALSAGGQRTAGKHVE